ncbi:YggS family pyridoxal phosphate-dependent enzyme [Arenibacter latericius]|uniref:YggS family pyridoxal phosphate-dependent enzyme n=1 Tax=Arenibacter latericius TaxID=86104 RepID=UPI000402CB0B|nr:YggS family pyridoxal phosphate-dependent enzyme [Arenibacter latericius]MDX1363578.1 YggS family pyridoxal phosphate-dependent enzyme [Arenibacter latericius]
MSIKDNLLKIKESLPQNVTLVAVSKTKPLADIQEAYDAGHRIFGENKVQEMTEKWESLPKDIEWHMIGHLQRNKVKYMASFVALVHGVDSLRLLKEINKRAKQNDRVIPCLLQVHIAEEESKFGFDETELLDLIHSGTLDSLQHIEIKGLMGMATFTENTQQVKKEFQSLKRLFDRVKLELPGIEELSMGMSGDYEIALAEGSSMVRLGSSIFGARN